MSVLEQDVVAVGRHHQRIVVWDVGGEDEDPLAGDRSLEGPVGADADHLLAHLHLHLGVGGQDGGQVLVALRSLEHVLHPDLKERVGMAVVEALLLVLDRSDEGEPGVVEKAFQGQRLDP